MTRCGVKGPFLVLTGFMAKLAPPWPDGLSAYRREVLYGNLPSHNEKSHTAMSLETALTSMLIIQGERLCSAIHGL